MNDWRCNDPCTAADTYIEWRFEQKCREIRDGKNLLTEWRRRKREYISFSSTIFIDFLHFSRHDGSHSISILESIEMLLGKEWIDSLSAGDLWMLLECAYMHDIGMSLDYEEIKELWETNESFRDYVKTALSNDSDDYTYKGALYFSIIDSILRNEHSDISSDVVLEDMFPKSWPVEVCRSISVLITDYIRRNHAERLQRKILKFDPTTDPVIPDRLNKSVVKACVLHGEDFEEIMKQLCYECKGFGNTHYTSAICSCYVANGRYA